MAALREIAARLRLGGANPFRARAYATGADAVEALSDPELKRRVVQGSLTDVEGLGGALAALITELARSGHAALLDRLLLRREPIACDVEAVLDVVARSRAAVEISGDPYRLDLPPAWIPAARRRGIRFAISTDAHGIADLDNVDDGVAMARRGGVRRTEVLNALSADQFRSSVHP